MHKIVSLGILALASAIVWAAASAPSTTSAATSSAAELATEARELAGSFVARLGQGYKSQIDSQRHIVYVSLADSQSFASVVRMLSAYHDYQRKALFPQPLRHNVVVVLPSVSDYKSLTQQTRATGIYNPRTRVIASISLSDVLIHEFTHALHANDQEAASQEHPIWLVEGLGMLFQRSRLNDGLAELLVDATLSDLQRAIAAGKAHDLFTLLAMGHQEFMTDPDLSYAEARYLLLYLARKGKLEPFYLTYKAQYEKDTTGRLAMEQVLGEPLDTINTQWRDWVMAQAASSKPAHSSMAFLGVKMAPVAKGFGVEVTGFVKNSTAERTAQIRPQDVIISVAGRPTPDPQTFTAIIQSYRPGGIVDMEILRGDQRVVIHQLLGWTSGGK